MTDEQTRIANELLATAARLTELANQLLESSDTPGSEHPGEQAESPAPETAEEAPMMTTREWLESVGVTLEDKQLLILDRIASATTKEMGGAVTKQGQKHVFTVAALEQAARRMGLKVPEAPTAS